MRTDSLICSFVFHDDGPEEDLMVVGIKDKKGQVPEPVHAIKGPEVLKIYHKLRGDDKHDRTE